MCCAYSDEYFTDTSGVPTIEEVQTMVKAEFNVEEAFVEHGVQTFYVRLREDSKEAFLRLVKNLESLELMPILRRKGESVVLRVLEKTPVQPNRNIINIALFFATLGTVFFSGYLYSLNILDAIMFTGAIMAILGTHEMGHKLLADKHDIEATYPYFIPGLPPIGTFGALIRQKALPPNRDALFDLGFTGPITGFIIAVIVTLIGIQLSTYVPYDSDLGLLPVPLLFRFIVSVFPPSGTGDVIQLHPVAFAGWVGMVVTMLNLVPSGMFDGGHVARSVTGERAHKILSYLGIAVLAIVWWPMAILALFFSATKHPGPLDDVSKLSNLRKVGAVVLLVVFILSVVQMWSLF